jgi:hypothetical protein
MNWLDATDPILGWLWKLLGLVQSVDVTAHVATIGAPVNPPQEAYVVTVTNRSLNRNAVVTHVLFMAGDTEIPVVNPEIEPHPTIPPEGVWYTWLGHKALLPEYQSGHERDFWVRLSNGRRVRSRKATNIPAAGIMYNRPR